MTHVKDRRILKVSTHQPPNAALYHDEEYMDIEIQLTLDRSYPDTEMIRFKTMPAMIVLSLTFTGSYEQIGTVNMAEHDLEQRMFAHRGIYLSDVRKGDTDKMKPVLRCFVQP